MCRSLVSTAVAEQADSSIRRIKQQTVIEKSSIYAEVALPIHLFKSNRLFSISSSAVRVSNGARKSSRSQTTLVVGKR